MAKKKDVSTGKQTTSSHANYRKFERIEKHTSPVRSKLEKIEKQIGSSSLRKSDRGKKTEKQDREVGGRKRKKFDAIQYKALFKSKRTRIESETEDKPPHTNTSRNKDVDNELKSQNSTRVQETPVKDHPQTKSLDDKSSKSDNHTFHTSSYRIENDLQTQQELDTCQKGEEVFEKINRERDEKMASLENDFKMDKYFIHALYKNPSIRSEKLKILKRERDKKLEEHESLWKIRLEELKATMLAAVGQVAAENEFSLHGSQHETRVVHSGNLEVASTLPENSIEAPTHDESVCEVANGIKSTGSHTSEKEMVDAAVSSEQIKEVLAQHIDDDMEVDVAEKVDSSRENSKGGTSCPDLSLAVEEHNETGAKDMVPHVDSGDMEMPPGNYNQGNVVEDLLEIVIDVAPEVESAEMGTPAGTCDKENAEDGDASHDTPGFGDDHNETSPKNVLSHAESAEMTISVDKVNAEDCIIRPDALHANEDHNDSCGSDSGDPVCAPISQDKRPSVQPVSSSASDHEIQNNPLHLEQLPDSGVQDEEINISILQPSAANQLDQIIPDDEPDSPSSTNPVVAENSSDTLPPSGPLNESTCEEPTLTVPDSRENLEENLVAATPPEEQQPHLVTYAAPTPPVNALNMFDNLTNQVSPQMPNQTHPLHAEVERLYTVKDNVTKHHQETKQRLDTERDKEIAEIVAQIHLKYEAKHQEVEAAYNSKKMELETNINRVIMNRILAEAYRSKCQDPTPYGHLVSQAELMQQLPRLSVSPSGNQQPPQPPPLLPQPQLRPPRPRLQIVHQPSALFSTTPSRLPPPALLH